MPKKIVKVSDDDDDEVDQINNVPDNKPVIEKKKYAKPPKERTPAQKEAFAKALTILKEKREMKKKEDDERYQKASQEEKERITKEKYERAKNHKKKLPPAPSYVTTGDLEKFKSDLLTVLKPKEPVEKPVEKVIEKPVEKPVPDTIVTKPIEKPKIEKKQITGHDLLDKLFFS